MRRLRLVLPFLAVGLIAAACVPTKPPAPDPEECDPPTVVVSPDNLCGWTEEVDLTGSGAFDVGPETPPAGSGSYHLSSGGDGDDGGEARLVSPVFLTPLDEFTSLRYSTLITDYAGSTGTLDANEWLTAALALAVDTDGDVLTTEDQIRVVFEPCYTEADCSSDIQALDTWTEWETIGTDKLWWIEAPAGEEHCGGGPAMGGGAEFENLTNLILDDCPDALVFQMTLRAGQSVGGNPWLDFSGAVDRLILDTATGPEGTFDFEA